MTEFPRASAVDGARFTAEVGLPNVVSGLFAKRPTAVKVTSALRTDRLGYDLVRKLVNKYGPGPFYVRVATDEALLVTDPADIRFVLEGSPEPFASDPEAKRKGMSAFQPDALTISRQPLWQARRAFAEAVLETASPLHSSAARFAAVAAEEAAALTERGTFGFAEINSAFRRMTRRIVLGEAAADDEALTEQLAELMAAGNKQPGEPAEGYDEFIAGVQKYIDAAEPGSLAALAARAEQPPSGAAGQVVHWLFAMGDTLAANTARALALLAGFPEQLHEVRVEMDGKDLADPAQVAGLAYLSGCLLEAMRLFPTTALFGRVSTQDVTFPSGAVLPSDTQVLIYNLFNHRDRERFDYADKFAPGEWASGDAGEQWSFNFFSHGPQGCPGAALSVFLGTAVLANILVGGRDLTMDGASLRPGRPLPHGVDVFALEFTL